MKNAKRFSFILPVTSEFKDLTRRSGIRIDHVGDLVINGVGYDNGSSTATNLEKRFAIAIEEISKEGVNILPVLRAFCSMENILEACLHHVHRLFLVEKMPRSDYQGKLAHYHW